MDSQVHVKKRIRTKSEWLFAGSTQQISRIFTTFHNLQLFVGQKTTKRSSIAVSSTISILYHAGTKQLHSGWALYKDGRWSFVDPQQLCVAH